MRHYYECEHYRDISLTVLTPSLKDEDYAGQLDCARRWFRTVHARDPRLVAATIVGDTLGRAGASQTHPHMQAGASVSSLSDSL